MAIVKLTIIIESKASFYGLFLFSRESKRHKTRPSLSNEYSCDLVLYSHKVGRLTRGIIKKELSKSKYERLRYADALFQIQENTRLHY